MLARGLKIFAILTVITLIAATIAILRQGTVKPITPLMVFDDSTEILLRLNRPSEFFKSLDSNKTGEFIGSFFSDTTTLPGIITPKQLVKTSQALFSYHPHHGVTIVLTLNKSEKSEKWIEDLIGQIGTKYNVTQNNESGNKIYSLKNRNLHFGIISYPGIVVLNQSFEHCRTIAQKLASDNIELSSHNKITEAEKLSSTSADGNIFINLPIGNDNKFPHFQDPGTVILDLWIKHHTILINGLSSGQMATHYLQTIKGTRSAKSNIEDVIPASSREYYTISTLHTLPLYYDRDSTINLRFKKEYGISIDELFERIFTSEATRIMLNNEHTAIGIKLKGKSTTEYNIKNMLETASGRAKTAKEHKYSFDQQTNFTIYQSEWGDITGHTLGQSFSEPGARYMTIVSDYLFISSEVEALRNIIDANILQQTVSNSIDHSSIKEHRASSSNIAIFQRNNSRNDILAFWLSEYPHNFVADRLNALSHKILWQVSYDLERPYHNIVIDFGDSGRVQNSKYEWKSRLESSSINKPTIISLANNEQGIAVQDSNHVLYMLNRQGRIIWQKQINGQILSEINQIKTKDSDLNRILFNTATTLYQLTIDGNDIGNYPIQLKSRATTGLSLFDYESNNNYRIAIPHEDKTLSMIDIEGKAIDGWIFKSTDSKVTTPVQHFKIGTKDYILLGDTLRIYILDRKGVQRIKPSELYGKAQNSQFYYSQSRKRWFTTTHSGRLMSISLDGTVRHEKVTELTPNHFYIYAYYTDNNKGNHIFVDKNILTVTDSEGKNLFTHTFKGEIVDHPSLYRFSINNRCLGIVDRRDGKVFLFDRNGKQTSNFPAHGITPFTITRYSNETNYHLLVGHIDGCIYDIKI